MTQAALRRAEAALLDALAAVRAEMRPGHQFCTIAVTSLDGITREVAVPERRGATVARVQQSETTR